MNIIELLKTDHREVSSFITELEGAGEEGAAASVETFRKLKNSLTLHARIEEEIFYPALEGFDATENLVEEAYQEHDEVKQLLEDMSDLTPGEEEFQDLLAQLKNSIDEHVEEEENRLFPQAEELLGEDALNAMGDEMRQIKESSGSMRMSGM